MKKLFNKYLSILLIFLMTLQTIIPVGLSFAEKDDDIPVINNMENINNTENLKEDNKDIKKDEEKESLDIKEQEEDKQKDEEKSNITEEKSKDIIENNNEKNDIEKNTEEEKTGFHFNLESFNVDGKPVGEENKLDPNKPFTIYYKWNLDNGHNYKEGDSVEFDLPKEVKVSNMDGELMDNFDKKFADYTITDSKTITFTFTKEVEELYNIYGNFYIKGEIDKENTDIEDGNIVIKDLDGSHEIKIPVDMSKVDANISKSGKTDTAHNPKEINWIITVDSDISIEKDGIVKDYIPEGLIFIPESLKVDKEKYMDYNLKNSELSINLHEFKGKKIIEFSTKIDDKALGYKNFTNNAEYNSSNFKELIASSTVSIDRGRPLDKKKGVYNSKNQEITWTVDINFDNKTISNSSIIDRWSPENMSLIEDSIKFEEVKINSDGSVISQGNVNLNHTIKSSDKTGFEMEIPIIDKPYRLVYKTKLDEIPDVDFEISNNINWNEEISGSTTKIKQMFSSKKALNPNYDEKTVDWEIGINLEHEDIYMPIGINDSFETRGLFVNEDDIEVYSESKSGTRKKLVKGERIDGKLISGDYSLKIQPDYNGDYGDVDIGNKGFLMEIGNVDKEPTSDKFIIKVKTKFTEPQPIEFLFKNKAKIFWQVEPAEDGGNYKVTEVEDDFIPNDYTVKDGDKLGNYNAQTKEIDWRIITNYRKNPYEKLIIKDLMEENQNLIKDSIIIYEVDIDPETGRIRYGDKVENPEIEFDKKINKAGINNDLIKINLGKTDKTYIIGYRTSLKDLNSIKANYYNTAKVYDNEIEKNDLYANVSIKDGGTYGNKSGVQSGKMMNWRININPAQATLEGLTLTDTISSNQMFLEDSIKIYSTKIDIKGNLSKDKEYDNWTYEISGDNKNILEIKFNDKIETGYILEYNTLFFVKEDNEIVGNKYNMTTKSSGGEDIANGESNEHVDLSSGGSAHGNIGIGRLLITKLDYEDKTVISGVKFELKDKTTGNIIKTGITDEEGKLDFGKLMFGDYILEEVEAPVGYVKLDPMDIKIDKDFEEGNINKKGNEEIVENKKNDEKIIIRKIDENGKKLAGAKFNILDSEGKIVQENLTTDENGQIVSDKLANGRYTLVETKAPYGYELSDKTYEIIVGNGDIDEIKVVNIKKTVDLEIIKKDKENKLLPNAEFKILDSAGNTIVENLKTDEQGSIKVSKLEYGNYELVETKAPIGYQNLERPIPIVVNDSVKNTIKLNIVNTLLGEVQVTKVEKGTNNPIADVEFRLEREENSNWKEIKIEKTDKNGLANFGKLEYGKYRLSEKSAPEGVIIKEGYEEFTVDNTTQKYSFVVENQYRDSEVELLKTDKNGKPLSGGKFELYQKNNNKEDKIIKNGDKDYYQTDKNGKVNITLEDTGDYYFVEVEAPKGYKLSSQKYEFKVEKGKNAKVHITNEKIISKNSQNSGGSSGGSRLPKTGSSSTIIYTIIGSVIVVLGGYLVLNKKKK